jgi:hypothetical protein
LHKIIGVCDACFKEVPEAEIESILNGIVSMLVLVSFVISWLWRKILEIWMVFVSVSNFETQNN